MTQIKPSFDTKRQILGEVFPLRSPFTVVLDSSEVCNFKCSYCFRSNPDRRAWGYAAKHDLMTWEVFEKAVEQALSFPDEPRQLSLSHHGEPLANKNLPKMIRYIRDKGYKGRISFHTNGSLLTPDYAKEIGGAGFSRMVLSVQGISDRSYMDTCGVNVNFQRFLDNVKILYEEKRKSCPDAEIDVKIADVALGQDDREKFFNIFKDISDRVFVETVVPIWKDENGKNKDMEAKKSGHIPSKFGEDFLTQQCCRLIFDTIVVLPNGDVYPCTQLIGPECIGNIWDDDLLSLWDGEKRKCLLESILTLNPPDMCQGCYIRQNSVYTKEDMIDAYRLQILKRLHDGV